MAGIRLLPLLLLLGSCTTVRPYANCPNAKAALALAERVVARVCLMDVQPVPRSSERTY